jgi:thiosulfate/3-mercaptopyruvate sulfurtransferase
MGMRRILSKRQFRCGIILAAFFAVLSMPAFAHPGKMDEQVIRLQLVDTSWVREHLDEPGVVIVDARPPEEYIQGHIAGAVNLSSADTYHISLKLRVASQSRIQQVLGRRGIRNDHHVIIYGCDNYRDASRVLWALALYGHPRLSLMNGGYPAWENANLPIEIDIPARAPASYRAAVRSGFMATRLQMLLAIDNPQIAIVDTRTDIEYQGLATEADRPGHIPTALNFPADLNLEMQQGVRYFKSPSVFEELYKDLVDYDEVILYCNNGCESSTTFLALHLLGKQVSIYDGGWREWSNNPGLPVVAPVQ